MTRRRRRRRRHGGGGGSAFAAVDVAQGLIVILATQLIRSLEAPYASPPRLGRSRGLEIDESMAGTITLRAASPLAPPRPSPSVCDPSRPPDFRGALGVMGGAGRGGGGWGGVCHVLCMTRWMRALGGLGWAGGGGASFPAATRSALW